MSRWFRWYEGTAEDGKFRQVARHGDVTVATVLGVWAVLLEDASHMEHRGIAVRGEPFWCAVLDMDEPTMVAILAAMEEANLISVGHGGITISKWKERQFEVDVKDPTAAERKRRERAKKKPDNAPKGGDAGGTPPSRPVTVTSRPDSDSDNRKKEEFKRFENFKTRKMETSNYLWLKSSDTRVPKAQQWWRLHYDAEMPLQTNDSGKQGYRVPWEAVT